MNSHIVHMNLLIFFGSERMFTMLSHLQSHADYLELSQNTWHAIPLEFRILYQTAFEFFRHLDIDTIHTIIPPLYSSTGRPTVYQIESLRALILYVLMKMPFPQLAINFKSNRCLRGIAVFF